MFWHMSKQFNTVFRKNPKGCVFKIKILSTLVKKTLITWMAANNIYLTRQFAS